MVAVAFVNGLHLHTVADSTDGIVVVNRRAPQITSAPLGRVQTASDGARRWVDRVGRDVAIIVSWRTSDGTHTAWVDTHEGDEVVYRDRRGRVERVILTQVSVTDLNGGLYDVAVTAEPVG